MGFESTIKKMTDHFEEFMIYMQGFQRENHVVWESYFGM